ncbi:MAG TPA: TadE family type IV pilus minor pilin [Pseudonocardiaceae bacterium]|jgi:Flp pilus assembly protein TadG|nr:TadE family type IV pilus minor pilin [Pseudonocardiaceae bacterium]
MGATSRAADPGGERDAGMVTVEAAVSLCAVLAVLAMVLASSVAALDQIRCTDAAREAARLVAMGQNDSAPRAIAEIAPSGATFTVAGTTSAVTVVVSAAPVGALLPGVRVSAQAYAVREPGTEGAGS